MCLIHVQAALLGATVRCSTAGDAVAVSDDNAERQKWKASLKAANTPHALVRTQATFIHVLCWFSSFNDVRLILAYNLCVKTMLRSCVVPL
jgi:hypothetical protein